MGIFARIWRLVKGWLLIGVEKAEDPEVILAEAEESMRREMDRAKEQAVQAIAARNQLRALLDEQKKAAANLEAKARLALRGGDEELARQCLIEKSTYDQNVTSLEGQLEQAERAAESVKANIKQMEAQVRQRAAQRLALVAGWKQAKIQERLEKSLGDISLDSQNEAFSRAEDRIRQLQAKTEARVELNEGNLNTRLKSLEQTSMNIAAEEELSRMKAELGGGPVTTQNDDLARLKKEIAETNEVRQDQPIRNLEV